MHERISYIMTISGTYNDDHLLVTLIKNNQINISFNGRVHNHILEFLYENEFVQLKTKRTVSRNHYILMKLIFHIDNY